MTEPPAEALRQLVDGFKLAQAVYAAAELGVADLLPAGVEELGERTGTHAPTLYRLLRALAAAGLFREEEGRRFALEPLGAALRSDAEPPLRHWVLHTARPLNWNAWSGLVDSLRDGASAFTHVHGEDTWAYRAARPEEQAAFDRGMAALTRRLNAALLAAVDWSRFGTVVDVGGGTGAFVDALREAHPSIGGVLFDRPLVVGDRPDAIGGDFFEEVPRGGDAYVLKSILHDWSDEDALRILESCRRADAPVVLVVERDVDAGLEAKLSDLNMLVLPGGRERSEPEFATLLEAAGFGYAGATAVLGAVRVYEGVRV